VLDLIPQSLNMLKNYLKIFWRNLAQNKGYTFLNIIGLSAGLTCFLLIALWVSDEFGYDKFNTKYDRIFRLISTAKTGTGTEESAVSSAPMAKALKQDYAEIENTVRLRVREEIITHNGQQILQPGILLTDPSFFDVFSYKILRGNAATALNEPYSIILTESTAKKYFGNKDPMGQTLMLNMYDTTGYAAAYTITGIMPDPPPNAHFTFTMLASFKTIEISRPEVLTIDGWGDANIYTYVLLKKGADYRSVSNNIQHFYGKYIGELGKIWQSIYFYKLQPLRDIHLRSKLQYEISAPGSITQVYIFSTIGIFILLLAGINYTNLATARSISRAKEVGIKKVVGADKNQLMIQYLLESVFTAIIALLVSCLLSTMLQPFFYQITGKDLSLFSSMPLLAFLLSVTILLGFLSGLYPAAVLSAFKPAVTLKGSFKSSDKGIQLRKTLVVLQFIITIVLMTGICVINSQMFFIKHKDLGYNKDALLFLRVNGNPDVIKGYSAFRDELITNPLISGVATSNSMITGGLGEGGSETVDNRGNPLQVNTARLRVDTDYFKVYGIQLLAGRNFSQSSRLDTIRQVIVNETAIKKIGWENNEAAIGKPFKMGNTKGVVIGVIKDFHFNSLDQSIEPLAIYPSDDHFSRITLNVDITKAGKVIAFIGNTWKKHFPSLLFDYNFVSQQIKEQYRSEERFSKIFLYFSLLSLLIACLGLYGLISYAIFQRTKEIGIRKVLGATAGRIAVMLSAGFVKLVLFAYLISIPIAWYIMNKWLQNFAYRVELAWWMFLVAGILVLIIALLTVSVQSIKAAIVNPIKNLRME
jgi:putative ABC transport system permease protein